MAQNAFEVLCATRPALMKVLDTNHDICDFLMGFYKHIEEVAAESPNDPKDMVCIVDIVLERLLKISISYYGSNNRSGSLLDKLPSKRNLNIANLLEVNHNVLDVALRVTSILERWLAEAPERKEQGFKNIKLLNARHWRDHTFTAEIVLKFQFEEFVQAKMKYDVNQPEQLTEEEQKQEEVNAVLGEKFVGSDLEWRK